MTACSHRSGRQALRALPALLLLLLAAPAAGLDTIWLVRHAEKADSWPADRDLDALQPLSREGTARAESLADRLKDAGISAIYTSRTTRTLSTALPLAARNRIPMIADDATTRPSEIPPFLARLRELDQLDVYERTASNQTLEQVGRLPRLRLLMLVGGTFDDDGVKHLAGLVTLEELSLGSAKVTDAAVEYLARLKNLRKLHLGGTKVTAAGRQQLATQLPRVVLSP